MTHEHEARCSECNNTNGEHKPFCTRWTDDARALGLRQCDLENLSESEVINHIAGFYGWKINDVLRHLPANNAELSPVELMWEVMNSIDAKEDADLKAWLETSLDPNLERLDGINPNLTNDGVTKWTPYDDLSEDIDTIIDGSEVAKTKSEIMRQFAKEKSIPFIDVTASKLDGDGMYPLGKEVEDDGFVTVFMSRTQRTDIA